MDNDDRSPNETFSVISSEPTFVSTVNISPEVRLFTSITVKYIFPFIIIIGTVGNGLSFAVLVRKRLRSNSLYFYFRVLAGADTLVLFVSCFKTWLRALTSFELLHVSSVSCKLVMFLLLVGMHLAAWIIVLVTVDRCVSVWLPFRAAVICTPRRARIITAIVFLLIIIYNAHVFWTIGLYENDAGVTQCISSPDILFMHEPFEYLKLATYSFIPFAMVFALNLAIIWKISRQPAMFQEENTRRSPITVGRCGRPGACQTNRGVSASRQQRVIYMLLTLSFSWLVLTAPYAIISVLMTAVPDLLTVNTTVAVKTVAFILLYLNHSINFYLYCVTGQKFRQEFIELVCRRRQTDGSSEILGLVRGEKKSFRTSQTPLGFHMNVIRGSNGTGTSV